MGPTSCKLDRDTVCGDVADRLSNKAQPKFDCYIHAYLLYYMHVKIYLL